MSTYETLFSGRLSTSCSRPARKPCFLCFNAFLLFCAYVRPCQKHQTGEEVYFKVKKTTRMEKVFNSYATRKGVQLGALRFLIDGQRVHNNDTPAKLELEDQDQIDCMLEQQGGYIPE